MKKWHKILTIIFSIISGLTGLVYSYVVRLVVEGVNCETNWSGRIAISIALMAITITINYIWSRLVAKEVYKFNFSTKNTVFENKFYDNNDSNYLSILTNDINTVENDNIRAKYELISCCVMFVAAWINLMIYSIIHATVILLFAIASVIISTTMRKRARQFRFAISKEQEQYSHRVEDLFLGIAVVKQFMAIKKMCLLHQDANKRLEVSKIENAKFLAFMEAISSIFSMSMFFVSFVIGVFLVRRGTYSVAIMMAAIQLVNNIVTPMFEIVRDINLINGSSAIMDKLKASASTKELENRQKIELDYTILKIEKLGYQTDNFKYADFKYSFESNKKYAIVGESGAGKSTLLNIIAGNIFDQRNVIYLDEKKYEQQNINDFKPLFSYMNQDVFVFNDSIKNNITLYEEFDESAYQNALKKSGVEKFIQELPEKDNCILVNNGENISGGEKQRIALARVLLRNSKTLLLDEAFSALDNINSREIMNDMMTLTKSIIMVVHKYDEETLKKFDKILVLKKGRLVEDGNFHELMEKHSYFYNLYNYNKE